MAKTRVEKRLELSALLNSMPGVKKVYNQPPTGTQMEYPCIIYKFIDLKPDHADNMMYNKRYKYQITVVDRDPDSPITELVEALPNCEFDRPYTASNLHHFVYNVEI